MQEKIEEDIRKEMATIIRSEVYAGHGGQLNYVHNAVDEIAKLFERKVIWEGEGRMALGQGVYDGTISDWTRTLHVQLRGESMTSAGELLGNKGGQHVRVIVKDIDESRT